MFKLSTASKFVASALTSVLVFAGLNAVPAQAATATINAVSFKAPVFDSYDHSTGGGVWNDGSVTYDKGELLGTNYKCGDIASFLLELNTNPSPTKQPAPYKAEISINYTWDSTGTTGASLTALSDPSHLKVNTGVIKNASGTIIGTANGTSPAGVTAGWDGGFNAAGTQASVATSPAPVVTPTGSEFGGNSSNSNVTFTVQNILAGSNIVVRSDAVIHCKPGSSPTGNMQAALMSVKITYPGAAETISTGNQTVNFRGVGNLAGLGSLLSVSKYISTNGTDCTATTSTRTFASYTTPVLYCYSVTNIGNNDITNVTLTDDNATPTPTTDDVVISMSIRGTPVTTPFTLLVGETATGTWSHTYTSANTYTNVVSATSSAPTVTASATAIMGSTPDVALSKVQTSSAPNAVSDTIRYNLVITNNTGNNSPVDVTDTNAASLTCGATTVTASPGPNGSVTINNVSVGNSSGATFTCTATHIVTAADVTAGQVSNFFTAAKGGGGSRVTYTSNTVTTPIVVRPLTYQMSVTKTQTSTLQPRAANDVITYDVQVTNIGTGPLTNVSLADLLSGASIGVCHTVAAGNAVVTLPISTFNSGASFICPVSYSVIGNDVTDRAVTNTARATSTGTGAQQMDSNTVITPVITNPSIQVIKIQATGSNANTGQYPSAVGQVLTYGISVINNGNVDLTGVIISDANATLTCPAGTTSSPGVNLAVGAVIECTASHTVTQADLTAGQIVNVASATGNGGGTTVSANSPNVTTIAALTISKDRTSVTNGANATAGDTITYSIVVKNTGEVTLTNLVIADANATVSCTASQLLSLAPGASVTCTATHIATLAEANAGYAYNTASVRTTQIPTAIISNQVSTPLIVPSVPHVSVVKARTSSAPAKEGDVVTYSITVTSDGVGNATVTGVTDANATLSNCNQSGTPVTFNLVMAPGDSFVCTATHTVTSIDIRNGSVSNTAAITANDGSSGNLDTTSNTVTDPLTETKSMSVVKSYTGSAPNKTGDVVHYSLLVTNTGTVTLANASVSDPLIPSLTCTPTQPVALFTPGATFTCTGTYTVTDADVAAGHVNNTATANATYNGSTPVSAASNTLSLPLNPAHVPVPELTITKQLNNTVNGKVGDVISYKITVTNSGETYLLGVNVGDENATIGACTMVLPTPLAQGESFSCVATHVITDADVAAGKVDNIAFGKSTNAPLTRNSNLVTVPLTAAPAIKVVKALAGTAPAKVGDVITYSITATNTGNVTLSGVVVTDANATVGACAPVAPVVLTVGASITCSATHVVTDADFAAGKVDNVAASSGTALAGTVNSSSQVRADSNVVTVPLVAAPAVSVVKTVTSGAVSKTGDTISYQIVATNTGNVTLTNVAITDANAAMGACDATLPTTLAVGASVTCVATHVVTDADFKAGKVDNVAVASATSPSGGSVNGSSAGNTNSNLVSTPLVANPSIAITKKQVGDLPSKIGGFIHYTITVTNTGNVNLHNVLVVDDNAIITGCETANPNPVLLIGASFTCSAKHALTDADVVAGKVVNIAGASSDENATASSGASGSNSGSNSGGTTSGAPGSVNVPSNEVLTIIKIAGMRVKIKGVPNGGTVTLGVTVLKNPDLKVLAFTGDLDNIAEDATPFFALLIMGAIAFVIRRRFAKK